MDLNSINLKKEILIKLTVQNYFEVISLIIETLHLNLTKTPLKPLIPDTK